MLIPPYCLRSSEAQNRGKKMTSNLRSILVETFSSVGGRVSPSRGARRLARGWHAARGGRRSALGRSAPDARSAVGTRPALFMHKPVNFHHEVALADGLMHRVVNFTHEGAHGGRRRAGDCAHLTRGTRLSAVPTRSASLRESHIRRRDGGMRDRPVRRRPRGTPAPRSARGDSGAPYRAGAAGFARPPPPSRRSA